MVRSHARFMIIFFLPALIFSCESPSDKRLSIDVSDVEFPELQIRRYGKALFDINPENLKEELKEIKDDFAFFLEADLDDTLNLLQIHSYVTDPALRKLAGDCFRKYDDLGEIEDQLTKALKHHKYYYPETQRPLVFSYISGIDFEFPVRMVDTVIIIGLDNYLGKDYTEYRKLGLPRYKRHEMERAFIVRDIMELYAFSKLDKEKVGDKLLDKMIQAGKKWYFIKAMMPGIHDTIVCGYTGSQLQWAKENEWNIWAFFVENNLLYSPDYQDVNKFMAEGPFTVFFGEESPARLGAFIGWQIIRKYMDEHRGVGIPELMQQYEAQDILTLSKYKPSR